MDPIRVRSSIALDTLCFLQKRLLKALEINYVQWMDLRQIEEIRYINDLLPKDFGDDYISMSNLCFILSVCRDCNLENLDLAGLIDFFKDTHNIETSVKEKLSTGYTSSYIYPVLDWLKNGFAAKYVKRLTALKDIGFEELYKERILPLVMNEIEQKQKEIAAYDIATLFDNISKLKNTSKIGCVNIYVSFFSTPTVFTLHNGSFLTCFCAPNQIEIYSIISHELMHGFSSAELTDLYRKHTASSEYLRTRHSALIKDWHSGDEEEFVLAAEGFLCYLSGRYTQEQMRKKVKESYGGNCPTAVSVFELLLQENEAPKDYNGWLLRQFKENKIVCTDN